LTLSVAEFTPEAVDIEINTKQANANISFFL
jgi:hypothetical protein